MLTRQLSLSRAVDAVAVGVAALARQLSLSRAVAAVAAGAVTLAKLIKKPIVVTATGVVSALLKLPFGKVPSGGSTTGMSRSRVVNK